MSGRRSPLALNLLLLATSLVVAAGIAEIALRVRGHWQNRELLSRALLDPSTVPKHGRVQLGHMIRLSANPLIIYELKPGLEVTFKGARATTNAAGFRGPEVAESKPAGTVRIFGLGDSFMFGHGVADGEVYTRQLEELLNWHSTGPRFEVINSAVPGYNTVMQVETLREKGLRYDPDVVLIHFVGNDLELPNFIRAEEPVLSLRRSFLVDLIRATATGDRVPKILARQGLTRSPQAEEGRRFEGDPEAVPPEYRAMVGWPAFEEAMGRLAGLATEHGFRVAAVTFSVTPTRLHRRVRKLSESLGFAFFDVGDDYRGYLTAHGLRDYRTSPLALSPQNMHPSALGHRTAARALYRYLCAGMLAADLSSCDLRRWDPPPPAAGPAAAGA